MDGFLEEFYGSDEFANELEYRAMVYNFDEMKLSIAALNSCEIESHRETDHRGSISNKQAQSVMDYWQKSVYDNYIKIIAIHHNPIPMNDEDREKWNKYLEDQEKKGSITADEVKRYESDILGLEGAIYLKALAKDCQVLFLLNGHQHSTNEESWPRKNGKGYIDLLSAGSFGLDESKLPRFQKNSFRLILLDLNKRKLKSTVRVYEPMAQAKGIVAKGHFVQDPSGKGLYEQDNIFLPPSFDTQVDDTKGESNGYYSSFTDYASNIKSFIDNYLGTPEQPVPFGGRETDLKNLNEWLDDPKAPQYLLLAARAGSGKSALLVRWRQQLLAKKEIALIFVPVSIRYGINLESVVLTALTSRLAILHGDKPLGPNLSTSTLRGMMIDYLSRQLPDGRKLLVILDGVDEAADWSAGPYLFPAYPPKNLRIVVSARYLAGDANSNSWLRRLGWNRPGLARAPFLGRLSREGVADVLRQVGVQLPSLSERFDIVHELHRLSEGDPLVLRLYVDDLCRKGVDAFSLGLKDLQQVLEPGLEGYFEDWWNYQCNLWDMQSEKKGNYMPLFDLSVCELLNIFACARGPLSRNDLLNLVSHEVKMDTWILEKSLKSLERIVIGDGSRQGYAFSHPKLGYYFYEKLVDLDRDNLESRFIAYGKDTLDALEKGVLEPHRASRYIVQYFGSHLEASCSNPELMLSLVNVGWLRAWESLEGAYSGFLNDVGRAWNAAEQADKKEIENGRKAKYLGKTILCALCFASVNSLSANIPVSLLTLLVKNKILNPIQALSYARQNPILTDRARALWELALEHEEPQMTSILEEALSAARDINDEWDRATTLAEIAPRLPSELKDWVYIEALSSARDIKHDVLRMRAVVRIAGYLEDTQKIDLLEEILPLAKEIISDQVKPVVLAEIAQGLNDPQKTKIFEEALIAAREIANKEDLTCALIQIAQKLPDTQKASVLEEALIAAREIADKEDQTRALIVIAKELPDSRKARVIEEALALVRGIDKEWFKANSLAEIAPMLPDPQKTNILKEAFISAKEIKDEARNWALNDIALKTPNPIEALLIAREIRDERELARTLADIAPKLSERKKKDVLLEAISLARIIRDEDERVWSLTEFAQKFPEPQKICILEEALSLAQQIKDDYQKALSLTNIAANLPDSRKTLILKEALSIARKIRDDWSRAAALFDIAKEIAAPQKTNILEETIFAARRIKDEDERILFLADIAVELPDPQKTAIIEEALSNAKRMKDGWALAQILEFIDPAKALIAIREIKDNGDKARALAKISANLADPQKTLYLEEALSMARDNSHDYIMAIVMADIASQHPDSIKALLITREIKYESERARALATIAAKFPNPMRTSLLEEALILSREIGFRRTDILTTISPMLAEKSIDHLYSLWVDTLHILSKRTRRDLLSDIAAMSPVIFALIDPESNEDIVQGIIDAGHLWP